jgi:hypothetical protein
MSGRLKTHNSNKRSRKLKCIQALEEARTAKKAKLSQDVIPCTPETTVHLEPQLFCATCSSQKIIGSNQITIADTAENRDNVLISGSVDPIVYKLQDNEGASCWFLITNIQNFKNISKFHRYLYLQKRFQIH